MINKKKTLEILRIQVSKLGKYSHKKVYWSCQDCDEEFLKAYREALKSKRCKSCSNRKISNNKEIKIKRSINMKSRWENDNNWRGRWK